MILWPNFALYIYILKVLIWHFLMKFMITIMYCSSASTSRGDVGSSVWWYCIRIVRNMHDHCYWWWWYGVVVVLQLVVVVVGSKPYLSTTLHPMCLVLVVGVVGTKLRSARDAPAADGRLVGHSHQHSLLLASPCWSSSPMLIIIFSKLIFPSMLIIIFSKLIIVLSILINAPHVKQTSSFCYFVHFAHIDSSTKKVLLLKLREKSKRTFLRSFSFTRPLPAYGWQA